MLYLVDGYNLAHWLAGDEDLGPQELRERLHAALAGRRPPDAEELHVYWDVKSRDPAIPAHEYHGWCTGHNVPDADAAIIDAVYAAPDPARCVVVSRDREVVGKSRQLGARVLEPRDLLGDVPGAGGGPRRPRGGKPGARRGKPGPRRGRKGRRR